MKRVEYIEDEIDFLENLSAALEYKDIVLAQILIDDRIDKLEQEKEDNHVNLN